MFKAKDKKTNKKFVAMKKVLMDNEKEGVSSSGRNILLEIKAFVVVIILLFIFFQFPITALREIRILQLLKHENVVNLIEICRTKG